VIDAKKIIADINFRLMQTTAGRQQIDPREHMSPVYHAVIETIVDHVNRALASLKKES
jgi:hypothetical protein